MLPRSARLQTSTRKSTSTAGWTTLGTIFKMTIRREQPALLSMPGRTSNTDWDVVNTKKTAFIATDLKTRKALKSRLGPDDPPVVPVLRDLGIDHQSGRFRRIPVLKTRYQKAKQRRLKLRSLRLPNLSNRLRLYKGGIQTVAMWGVEAQGLAPRYRTWDTTGTPQRRRARCDL